jgi:hypothetical protein
MEQTEEISECAQNIMTKIMTIRPLSQDWKNAIQVLIKFVQ